MPIVASLICMQFSFYFRICLPLLHISIRFHLFILLTFGDVAPTTTKSKKIRGAAIAATPAKKMRRAGNKKMVPSNSGQGHLPRAEDAATQKLDALMKSIADLSGKM